MYRKEMRSSSEKLVKLVAVCCVVTLHNKQNRKRKQTQELPSCRTAGMCV